MANKKPAAKKTDFSHLLFGIGGAIAAAKNRAKVLILIETIEKSNNFKF